MEAFYSNLFVACISDLQPTERCILANYHTGWHLDFSTAARLTRQLFDKEIDWQMAKSAFQKTCDWLEHVENAHVVFVDQIIYPPLLRLVHDPPFALFYKGELPDPEIPVLALCGDNTPTWESLLASYVFVRELPTSGVRIATTYANGVDKSVHRAALDAHISSLLILDKGIEILHPIARDKVLESCGCVVSEYHPYCQWRKRYRYEHSRVLVGIAASLLLFQVSLKSLCYQQALFALDHGREIYVHPVSLEEQRANGSRRLVSEGAQVVGSYRELLAACPWNFPNYQHFNPLRGQTSPINGILDIWQVSENSTVRL